MTELRWHDEVDLPEPEWCGPNDSVIGGPVLCEPVLVRSPDLMVMVRDVVLYPFGMAFRIEVLAARATATSGTADLHEWDDPLSPGGLHVAVTLPDGHVVAHAPATDHVRPAEPVLVHRGAEAGPDAWAQDYWLWPAPDPGDVRIDVRWSDRGVVGGGTLGAAPMQAGRGRIIG